jgi:hypothetical protein
VLAGKLPSIRDELPPATIEALLHRLLRCIETQAGAALSVCADAVVGNELSAVRWHFVSFLRRRTPVSPLPVLRDPRGRVSPWVTLS